MIDRRELFEKARERNLTLGIVEKDYVLGWLLFGLSEIKALAFKGGTALSKVYFSRIWRLSEDLDFVYKENFQNILERLPGIFDRVWKMGGIKCVLKTHHSNPDYLQLKIQYEAVLGKNWIKVDVTRETPVDRALNRKLARQFSDYPSFKVRVESVEEIAAEKIRSLLERKKSRDYYDVWQLMKLSLNREMVRNLVAKKFEYKGMEFKGLDEMFPKDLFNVLEGYWNRELGRLMHPVPKLERVIHDLENNLLFLARRI